MLDINAFKGAALFVAFHLFVATLYAAVQAASVEARVWQAANGTGGFMWLHD